MPSSAAHKTARGDPLAIRTAEGFVKTSTVANERVGFSFYAPKGGCNIRKVIVVVETNAGAQALHADTYYEMGTSPALYAKSPTTRAAANVTASQESTAAMTAGVKWLDKAAEKGADLKEGTLLDIDFKAVVGTSTLTTQELTVQVEYEPRLDPYSPGQYLNDPLVA